MSRVGKRELPVPEGVTVTVENKTVKVSGKLGALEFTYVDVIDVVVENNVVKVTRKNEIKHTKQLHGTTNALINNMIIGVSEGYKKDLEINGVGYRFAVSGKELTINAGYSDPKKLSIPEGLKVEVNKNTELTISGIDKQKVTEFAANVRKVRPPEPYKGKGIRYKDEHIRRKEGKKAA